MWCHIDHKHDKLDYVNTQAGQIQFVKKSYTNNFSKVIHIFFRKDIEFQKKFNLV
jgi:hypothetical protein